MELAESVGGDRAALAESRGKGQAAPSGNLIAGAPDSARAAASRRSKKAAGQVLHTLINPNQLAERRI
jgi:hypothetical protein